MYISSYSTLYITKTIKSRIKRLFHQVSVGDFFQVIQVGQTTEMAPNHVKQLRPLPEFLNPVFYSVFIFLSLFSLRQQTYFTISNLHLESKV